MVVGSDRVREFETILNKYNDVRSSTDITTLIILMWYQQVKEIEREGVSGMSASKMILREKGDMQSFKEDYVRIR